MRKIMLYLVLIIICCRCTKTKKHTEKKLDIVHSTEQVAKTIFSPAFETVIKKFIVYSDSILGKNDYFDSIRFIVISFVERENKERYIKLHTDYVYNKKNDIGGYTFIDNKMILYYRDPKGAPLKSGSKESQRSKVIRFVPYHILDTSQLLQFKDTINGYLEANRYNMIDFEPVEREYLIVGKDSLVLTSTKIW